MLKGFILDLYVSTFELVERKIGVPPPLKPQLELSLVVIKCPLPQTSEHLLDRQLSIFNGWSSTDQLNDVPLSILYEEGLVIIGEAVASGRVPAIETLPFADRTDRFAVFW